MLMNVADRSPGDHVRRAASLLAVVVAVALLGGSRREFLAKKRPRELERQTAAFRRDLSHL